MRPPSLRSHACKECAENYYKKGNKCLEGTEPPVDPEDPEEPEA